MRHNLFAGVSSFGRFLGSLAGDHHTLGELQLGNEPVMM
jgi:hypothetical protein